MLLIEGHSNDEYNSSRFIDECISKNIFTDADTNIVDTIRMRINGITTKLTKVKLS